MKRSFKSVMFIAAAAIAFAGCQPNEIEKIEQTGNGTHTVTFTAELGNTTKTTMSEGTEAATFSWTSEDGNHFVAYENGVAANEAIGVLEGDIMKVTAEFNDGTTSPYTYTAILNGCMPSQQVLYDGKYDETSDVLVAKPVESADILDEFTFQFKRVVALNKMTIKGLGTDEIVSKVVISSDKAIAGDYDVKNDCWVEYVDGTPSNTITLDGGEDEGVLSDEAGNAVVYFNCVPVDGAQLIIDVTTDKATYSKTFSKTISLLEGQLNKFGVTVDESVPVELTFDFKNHPSGWPEAKGASKAGTYSYTLNSVEYNFTHTKEGDGIYCGGTSATSGYLFMASGNLLGLPAMDGYKLTKVVGTLNDSGTPSTASKISVTDGTSVVSGGEEQTWDTKGGDYTYELTDTDANTVYYLSVSNKNCQMITLKLTYEPSTETAEPKYVVSCESVTGGTISASPAKAKAGSDVELTATPNTGYSFNNDWSVADAEGSPIAVTDNKFTMPASNVTVSASFSKVQYTITKESENGSFTVTVSEEEVNCACYQDEVTLNPIPAEGYIFDSWTVKETDGTKTVSVSDNSFTMPAYNVTITATFKEKPEEYKYTGDGTKSNPYTVTDVKHYIDGLGGVTSSEEVYVTGTVSKVDSYNSQYSSITYWLDDNEFEVYGGLGSSDYPFTSKESMVVGATVVVKGYVKKYSSTYEFDKNNVLVSIQLPPYLKATASKTTGISAVGETITITVDTNIDSWTASITGDSTFALDEDKKTETTIPVIVSENTDVENGKNATVTITAGDKTVEIQLSQLAKTDGGQSSTAFEWTGSSENGKESLTSMVGVTASGLGTDYATSNAPYRVKFDTTGDYIIINVGYEIASVQLTVKMLGGANSSSIKIQESSDGDNFTDNSTMSISGKQNDVVDFTTSNAFNANSRYVKLYFTKGSNVGLGYIKISPNN